LSFNVDAFERLIRATVELKHGFGQITTRQITDRDTVVGALYDVIVILPGWLYRAHAWYLLVALAVALVLWAVFGGAICRMTALHATHDQRLPALLAMRFVLTRWRWLWFVLAPLIPLVMIALMGLVLAVGGWLLFSWPGPDILGGLLFVVALAAAAMMAMLLIGLATGGHLMYPAIAVEDADAFDAVTRGYNFSLGRPWRWAFYSIVSLGYGAVTYLFVGLVVYLTLRITHLFVGAWVGTEASEGVNRFAAIMPQPRVGNLDVRPQWSELGFWAKVPAALVSVWVYLCIGLLAAYAISFYFSAQTWIYLLLRRAADGTEFDEVYLEDSEAAREPAWPDKVEPAGGQEASTD